MLVQQEAQFRCRPVRRRDRQQHGYPAACSTCRPDHTILDTTLHGRLRFTKAWTRKAPDCQTPSHLSWTPSPVAGINILAAGDGCERLEDARRDVFCEAATGNIHQ